ncbi:MAG TPA: hypothetical protein VNL71_08700 [Chloroflexota bacterium]|nr:hypothetical protein [Chloroflexota bacterium]
MHLTQSPRRWLPRALAALLVTLYLLMWQGEVVRATGAGAVITEHAVSVTSSTLAYDHQADPCLGPVCIPDPLSGVLSAISGLAGAIAALPATLFAQVSNAFGAFLSGLEAWISGKMGGWIADLVQAVADKGLALWHGLWAYVGAHVFGWLGDVIDGIASAIGGFIAQMATNLITVVTTTPEFLGPGSGLTGLYTAFWTFALVIAGSLFVIEMMRGLALSWGATTLGPSMHGIRRGAVGLVALQLLNPSTGLLNTWVDLVNGLVGAVTSATDHGPNGLAHALAGYVDFALKAMVLSPGFALSLGLFLVAGSSAVLLVLCAVIVLQRLGGLFVLGGLIVVAPLCAVALISQEFRQFGRWWFVNFVTYSLWGFGYALVLCVIGELLVVGGPASSSLAGSMGSDLLYHVALPLAGILVLLRVPRIMDTMLGAMGSRLVGATAMIDGAAGVASTAVMSAARGAATRAIRLGGRP